MVSAPTGRGAAFGCAVEPFNLVGARRKQIPAKLGRARPDCPETLVGHRISGLTCLYFGDIAGAHDHFQKTIKLYDQARLSSAAFASRARETG